MKKYNIAILLPTRGRTHALDRSVRSLVDNAHNMDNVQIMFGFDRDDAVGLTHFRTSLQPELDQLGVNYVAVQFNPLGYIRLNEYVNYLALNSNADWLIFWNDDAMMETAGWDQVIKDHTGQFKLLAFHSHNDHPYSIFPIVPRAWLDLLGYLSPHQISDGWLSHQAYLLDIWQRIPVHVTHDRYDLTGNNHDETYKNRPMLEGNPADPRDFNSAAVTNLRFQDCGKLADYMKTQGLDTSFFESVMSGQQNPWQKLAANDVNRQMKQFKVSR